MSLLNTIISTNSLFLLAKSRGYIPLSSNRLLLRSVYKHENGYEFVVYDLSETRTNKLHRFILSLKDILILNQFISAYIPVEKLVHYLREQRQSKYSFIPENMVVTLSIPDGQLILESKEKICITLYSSRFYAREEHYFTLEEWNKLQHSWFKFSSFLTEQDTFWVRYINGIYEVVKYHQGGNHVFVEFGKVSLSRIDSEAIEDHFNLNWDYLSNHEKAIASLLYHDLIEGSYCLHIRYLKKELQEAYSIPIK